MHFQIQSILALAYLAAAVPTPELDSRASDPFADVIDPWGQYGHKPANSKRDTIGVIEDDATNSTLYELSGITFTPSEIMQHAKRVDNADTYRGFVPGCDDDPSYATQDQKGPYGVRTGIKVEKSGKDDECTHGSGADHCWTEYWLAESAIEYSNWQNTASAVNCPSGSKDSCSVNVGTLTQSCSTTTTTISNGFDLKIFESSLTIPVPGIPGGTAAFTGLSPTYNHQKTTSTTEQACKTDQSSATCTWNNDGGDPNDRCHQVWYADRVLHVWGYAMRVCNKCSNGNVQQKTGNGDNCVRGQKQMDFLLPINKLVHCDGKCGVTNPGLTRPTDEPKRKYGSA